MNVINHVLRYKKALVLALACALVGSLGAVDTNKQMPRHVGRGEVWVKTSDEKIIEIPQWQIDQMKVLQVMFVQQKGKNNKNNPVKAPMLTSEQLALLQMALQSATNAAKFAIFCEKLGPDEKKDLINSAFAVEATGLASLLMTELFPQEVQEKLGAVYSSLRPGTILESVIGYLNKAQKTVLQGHQKGVTCVAFSPDGNYIVSGSSDKNLILWNAHTGEQIKILAGHQDAVCCVAFSPDGNYIVSGSWDRNLILWNSRTGEQIKTLTGHQGSIMCVAFSPDGNCIVSGSADDNLILWNAKTGDRIKILRGHASSVACVAYSPDRKYIVSGSWDGNLILWDAKTGKQIKILRGQGQFPITCVAYSPDGKYIVSGSADNNLILWNGTTGEQIKTLTGHQASIACVAYSPDGEYIISGSWDKKLILWNAKTGEQIQILQGHQSSVMCVAYSPDGNDIVSGSNSTQNNLILWKLCDQDALDFITHKLTLAQARFLYRLYLAQLNKVPMILDDNDADYVLYKTFPENVQQLIATFLPFQLASSSFAQAVQAKLAELKAFFSKLTMSIEEKIKRVKQAMENNPDKSSVDYKASENLLHDLEDDLELEAAFNELEK